MDGKTVAYVVRHGDTELNDENKYRGQMDIPLNDEGKEDAEELAELLKDKSIGQAFTSPLSRATETARAILKGRGLEAVMVPDLLPLDSGKFSGQSKDKHKKEMQFYHEHTDERIPGGESIDELHDRSRRPLLKAFRAGVRGEPSLISAHSSIVHSVGDLLHNDHESALVHPGGMVEIIWDGKKFHAVPMFKAKDENKGDHYAS